MPLPRPRHLVAALSLGIASLLFAACHRSAKVVDAATAAKEWNLPCKADNDCHFTGNACTSTVYCAHRDAQISVIEIGCDAVAEYGWPDDSECKCSVGVCSYTGSH